MNKMFLVLMCLLLVPISGATITHVGEITGAGSPNYLSYPWDMYIEGNYAYITAEGDDCLTIIDISDKTNPTYEGRLCGAGAPNYLGGVEGIYVSGNYAYVTTYTDNSLTIIDITDKSNPIFVGQINGSGTPNYLNYAIDVEVEGNYAYVAALQDNSLTIIDISTPAAPSFAGHINGSGAPNYIGNPYYVELSGDYAYVASGSDSSLTVINISDPITPSFAGHINGSGAPNYLSGIRCIYINNNVLYTASSGDDSMSSFDISDPENPILMDALFGTGAPNYLDFASGVYVNNDIAFVASYIDDSLVTIDVSIPANLRFIERITGAGSPNYLDSASKVKILGDYAYVASRASDHALTIFDISGVSTIAEPTFDFSGYSGGEQIFKTDITGADMDMNTPSIGESGTIYIYPYGTSKLYAFYPDGTEKWNLTVGASNWQANPVVDTNETVYVLNNVAGEYAVVAVYSNGSVKYRYETNDSSDGAIAVGSNNYVYAVSVDTVRALDENGALLWSTAPTPPGELYMPPCVSDTNQMLYISSYLEGISAINTTNGTEMWYYDESKYEHVFHTPALSLDESIVYFLQGEGTQTDYCILYAFDAVTGVLEWKYNTTDRVDALHSPTVLSDGAIVFGGDDAWEAEALYCVESDGTLRWRQEFADVWNAQSNVVELGDGSLVLLHYGDLYSINSATGVMTKIFNTVGEDNRYASVSVASNGNLYFTVDGNSFYGVKGSVAAAYDYADYTSGLVPNNFHIWRNQPNSLVPTLSNVRIISTTTGEITTGWDLDAITDNVKVYRDTNTNFIGQSTGTLYTDTNLASGTRYNYWLQPWSGAIVGTKYAISGSTDSTGGGVPTPTPTITPLPTIPPDEYNGWGNFSITVPNFWKSPLWLILLFMLVTLMMVGYATEERK